MAVHVLGLGTHTSTRKLRSGDFFVGPRRGIATHFAMVTSHSSEEIEDAPDPWVVVFKSDNETEEKRVPFRSRLSEYSRNVLKIDEPVQIIPAPTAEPFTPFYHGEELMAPGHFAAVEGHHLVSVSAGDPDSYFWVSLTDGSAFQRKIEGYFFRDFQIVTRIGERDVVLADLSFKELRGDLPIKRP